VVLCKKSIASASTEHIDLHTHTLSFPAPPPLFSLFPRTPPLLSLFLLPPDPTGIAQSFCGTLTDGEGGGIVLKLESIATASTENAKEVTGVVREFTLDVTKCKVRCITQTHTARTPTLPFPLSCVTSHITTPISLSLPHSLSLAKRVNVIS